MNEEIKKILETRIVDKIRDLFYMGLVPMEEKHIEGIMEVVQEAYLLGAKDMAEAVNLNEVGCTAGGYTTYEAEAYNDAVEKMNLKAQQFIDSLEKDKQSSSGN